ncbi:MAG: Mur ligase family protein [Actinobacteria bacterium]|nr:Mur ligase family protein [Actinomycetota bacterium]
MSAGVPAWAAYLESLAAFGMRPGLERVSALLDVLGRPQDAYRVIHIVGTNGKSSTTRYCEALLRAHGRRAGAYLSPHISGWTERVVVDGRPVDEAVFAACVNAVRAATEALPEDVGETTQFEVLTVAALLAMAESGVEVAALEAGLGGRLDATNVVDAPLVVLTNIALEHTEVLGDTRALIFAEKAAVIKGGDAVFGALDGLEREARRVCSAAGARPYFLREETAGAEGEALQLGDVSVAGSPGDFRVALVVDGAREEWAGLSVPTPALYQVANAGLAVVAVRLLLGRLDEVAAREALAATAVPGRLQKVGERPLVLADGAHNPDGVRALARSLAAVAVPKPTVGVLAIMRDKGYEEMLECFIPLLDAVVCTQASEPRSLTAEELAAALRTAAVHLGGPLPEVRVAADPHVAVALARASAGPGGSVLIGGSLYLLEDLHDLLASLG